MSYVQSVGSMQRRESVQIVRPWGITAVSALQFFRAAVLFLTGILLRIKPGAVSSSDGILYPLLSLALRGNPQVLNAVLQGSKEMTGTILILGCYLAVIGAGLWRMRPWARRSMIVTSALTVLLFMKSMLSAETGLTLQPHNLPIPLIVDAILFVYLMRGSTAAAFTKA